MYLLGIDVGTTETKCCLMYDDKIVFEQRKKTPRGTENSNIVTFQPSKIHRVVEDMLNKSLIYCEEDDVVVSIVSQAPSLVVWNDHGDCAGISYLSFYGDPTENDKKSRFMKAQKRLEEVLKISSCFDDKKVSCITGYLVYMLTKRLTLDSITAWELGIESTYDEKRLWDVKTNLITPKIQSPIDCTEVIWGRNRLRILTGTTDSAVLPLAVENGFSDYYIYLGTWGCLLKTEITDPKMYAIEMWNTHLHRWLVSISNFSEQVINGELDLDSFFEKSFQFIDKGSKVSISGGILNTYNGDIYDLIEKYSKDLDVKISSIESTAYAAAALANLAKYNRSKV